MADPATYRPAPGQVPDQPGVYRFRDAHGRVIYVGKAKSLRSRLGSYFQDLAALHPRTQSMVTSAASVEWTVVGTEVEALALEYSWIKEFDPRFNVKYRDDKSYPYLAVTLGDQFPRVQVMRGAKRPGTRYFGPYAHAWAIRETVDLLLRVFPVRTCSAGVFKRAHQQGRPCLLGYIDKCSAPVRRPDQPRRPPRAGRGLLRLHGRRHREVHAPAHRADARGRGDPGLRAGGPAARRHRCAASARPRRTPSCSRTAPTPTSSRWSATSSRPRSRCSTSADGRIRGQRGWIVEKVEDVTDGELVEHLLQQVYGAEEAALAGDGSRSRGEPAAARPGPASSRARCSSRSCRPTPPRCRTGSSGLRGSRVDVRVPQRGDKRELAETVRRNAEHALVLHRTKRAGDLTTRSQALREIQEALDLPSAPLRIECYDISTTQGTHQMASMVVFEDGLARKSEYRTFAIRGPEGDGARDDTAAMHEVITRRFRRYVADRVRTGDLEIGAGDDDDRLELGAAGGSGEVAGEVAGRPERFAYPPNLVVVDGGPPQVAAAARALAELGVDDVALCGLAKRLEEVWLPGEEYPVILQRSSEGLYLLQRVRDEAHRFAITAHRRRRTKGMTASALDDVPGLGPARSRALLTHFGSLKRLRAASVEEIATVPGMGQRTAAAVVAALAQAGSPGSAAPAPVSMPTPAGEATVGAASTPIPPGLAAPRPGRPIPDGARVPRPAGAGVPGMLGA